MKTSFKRPAPPAKGKPVTRAKPGAPAKSSAPNKPTFKQPTPRVQTAGRLTEPDPELEGNEDPALPSKDPDEPETRSAPGQARRIPRGGGDPDNADTIPANRRVAKRDDDQRDPNEFALIGMMQAPVGQPAGQYDARDIDWPRLQLAQRVGPLVEEIDPPFTPGDWVLNQEAILWQDGCAPFELTVLRWGKLFQQQTAYGEDMGTVYDTHEAAEAAGLIYFGGDEVGFTPIQNAIVLIKQPEGVECSAFNKEHGDELFAVAMWIIRGVAYSRAVKKVNAQYRTRLNGGLHTGSFLVEAREEKGKVNNYFVPLLREGTMHDAAFIEFAESCANG